jgi:hypothetical protein
MRLWLSYRSERQEKKIQSKIPNYPKKLKKKKQIAIKKIRTKSSIKNERK